MIKNFVSSSLKLFGIIFGFYFVGVVLIVLMKIIEVILLGVFV